MRCQKCGDDDHLTDDHDAIIAYAEMMHKRVASEVAKPLTAEDRLRMAYYERGAFGFDDN